MIDSARVLSYAFVGDLPYHGYGSLFVDGHLLEAVGCLAIVVSLGEDADPLLLYCDQDWQALGASGGTKVGALRALAEKNYPGLSNRWVDVNTSVDDALRYYDAQSGMQKCDFCGRRRFEVDAWVEGCEATICKACVDEFYRNLHKEGKLAQGD